MTQYLYLLIFLIIIANIFILKWDAFRNRYGINIKESYRSKYILTANEYIFYKQLKQIADEHDLILCPKVGLKDLFAVTNKRQYMKAFSKIAQKHIDFLICDHDLQPIAAIELDDNSHIGREYNDGFKNELFANSKLKLVRIKAYPDYTKSYIKKFLIDESIIKD